MQTIRQFSRHRIAVLCSEEVSLTTLSRLRPVCDDVIVVESIHCPYIQTSAASWTSSGLTKLRIWGLTQFQKIIYVDADAILTASIDELFELEVPFAAAPDIFPPDKFNAGVLVVTPDQAVLNSMLDKIEILSSYDGGDTGFLNAFFPDWFKSAPECRLSFGYNAQRTLYWFTHEKRPGYWESISPLKVIHYSSSPKPWEMNMMDALQRKGDLEWIWWQEFLK